MGRGAGTGTGTATARPPAATSLPAVPSLHPRGPFSVPPGAPWCAPMRPGAPWCAPVLPPRCSRSGGTGRRKGSRQRGDKLQGGSSVSGWAAGRAFSTFRGGSQRPTQPFPSSSFFSGGAENKRASGSCSPRDGLGGSKGCFN